ncbi:MAG: glycosyltransferase family 4 protein [Pseudomonadota bacterium]
MIDTSSGQSLVITQEHVTAVSSPPAKAEATASAAHLLHVFPTFGFGGVPIRISNVINHLGGDYRHSILALDNCHDSRSRLSPKLTVKLLSVDDPGAGSISALWAHLGLLRRLRPDLLLTYNWGSIEVALANRLSSTARHIHFESGFGREEADRQLPRRVRFRRLALAKTERLVVPSQKLYETATKIWQIDPARVSYVPNGVDCVRFDPTRPGDGIPDLALAPDVLTVGTVAPLRPEKNVRRLIDAFALLRDSLPARLVIVGDGPERGPLEAHAQSLGIGAATHFAGHVEQVERVLGAFDLFALSSDTEQMPNSVLQAMAAGRAIASVDVGDVKHMLAPDNRPFVVPKDQPADLAEAMKRLLESPQQRRDIGRANRSWAEEHFDQARMFEAYRALFDGKFEERGT